MVLTIYTWVKVFMILPEFRVFRLMVHRKSAELLNLVDFNSFLDLFSVYLRTFEFFFNILLQCVSFKIYVKKL